MSLAGSILLPPSNTNTRRRSGIGPVELEPGLITGCEIVRQSKVFSVQVIHRDHLMARGREVGLDKGTARTRQVIDDLAWSVACDARCR